MSAVPASRGPLQRMRGWWGNRAANAAASEALPVRAGGMEYRRTTATPASVLGLDQALIWVVVALLAWGLVMVYSASIAMPDNPRFGKIAPMHFLLRHAMALAMAFVAALLAFQVSMATWERSARALFVFSLALLVLVLVPHVGTVVNGARRWLSLGFMNFQPSELAKFAVLVWAYAQEGKAIPRSSQAQALAGQPVAAADIRPGDLVIYYPGSTHVGMYAGDGLVLHAPTYGVPVKLEKVDAMPVSGIRRY